MEIDRCMGRSGPGFLGPDAEKKERGGKREKGGRRERKRGKTSRKGSEKREIVKDGEREEYRIAMQCAPELIVF